MRSGLLNQCATQFAMAMVVLGALGLWSTTAQAEPGADLKLRPVMETTHPNPLSLGPGELRPPDPELQPGGSSGGRSADPSQPRNRRVIKNGAYILYFYEHDPVDDETLLHILGLFWYRGKPDWQLYVAAPFGAYWKWNDGSDRWGLISPLAWHVEGEDVSYSGAWLWHRYRSPQTRFDTLFPIYWHHHDLETDDNLHILGPLFARSSPQRWQAGIFPLFWMGGGEDSAEATLLPIFHYTSDPTATRLFSPAFFHVHDKLDGSTFGMIPPLLTMWGGEDDDDEGWVAQFPLYLRYWDDDFRLTLLTPLIVGLEEEDNYEFGMVFPLFVGYEDDDTAFKLFLPGLYARWLDKRSGDYFGMMGPLYAWRDDSEKEIGIWPLVKAWQDEATGDATTALLPIYYASEIGEESHRYFLPLLYADSYFDPEHYWTFVGPLFNVRDGQETWHGLAPLVFVHEDDAAQSETTAVFPLYLSHRTPTSEFRLIAPLLYARSQDEAADSSFYMLGPAFYDRVGEEQTYGVWPLFLHWEDPEIERSFTLVPGLYYNNEGPDWATSFWGPAFHRETPDKTQFGLLPLGMWEEDRAAQTRSLFIAPGVYWSDGPDRRRLMLGPLWSFRDGATRSDGLFPLLVRHREQDGSGFFFVPGGLDIRDGGDDGWRFTWILNGFRYTSTAGRRTSMVFPLFLESYNKPTGDYWAMAPPWVYVSGNDLTEERFIFAPPFFYDSDHRETDWWLFPLAFGHDDPNLAYWLAAPFAFSYHDKTPGGANLTMGPLLFGSYTSGDQTNVGTPEGVDGPEGLDAGWMGPFIWSDTHARRFHMLFPLILDYEDFEEGEKLFSLFPLIFNYERQQQGIRRTLDAYVPFYIRYAEEYPDGSQEISHILGPAFAYAGDTGYGFGLFPLFLHDRATSPEGDSGSDIIFPIVWHFFDEAEETSTLLAGPLYSLKEPGKERYGILPLWFHKTEEGQHGEEGYDAVFPFYWYGFGRDEEGARMSTLLTPAGYFRRHGSEAHGLVLNYWFSRDKDEATDFFFPLVYSRRDKISEDLFIAPLYWHTDSPSYSAQLILPFYFHSEDHIAQTSSTWFGPYIGYDTEYSETDIVLPLYYQSRNDSGDLFRLVAPLYLQIEDGYDGSQFVMAGPVWYSGDGGGGYDTGVFPLLWWGEDAEEEDSYFVGFPLVWRFNLDAGDDVWTVAAPLWLNETPETTSAGLFPVIWWHDETETDDGHLVVAPFFWRISEDEGEDIWTVLTPFWHHKHRDGYSAGLFPLAFIQEDTGRDLFRLMLAPIYHSSEGEESFTTVFPLFWHWDDGQDNSALGILPFYYGQRYDDGSRFDTIGGLVWNWADPGDNSGGTVAGPLYHMYDDDSTVAGIAPLAHYSSDEERTRAWLLPVAYMDRAADGEDTRVIAGPVFYDHDETGTDWGVAPLFWSFQNEVKSGSAAFPLYYYEGREDGHTFASPLVYSSREGDDWAAWSLLYAGAGDADESWHTVFPIFYGRRSSDGESLDVALPFYVNYKAPGGQRGGKVVFPLYWNFYDNERGTDATVLFPIYWHFTGQKRDLMIIAPWFKSEREDAQRITHGLIPFYYYSADPYGYTFNVLGGFFGIDHTEGTDETDYQILWIPF